MEYRHYSHEDVTNHKRSPAEESFYESFLLQKESDIGNLYASNLYEVQCYSKQLKHINKQCSYQTAEINREMKKIQRKMDNLKSKCNKVHFLSQKCASSSCISGIKSASNSPSLPRLSSRESTISTTSTLPSPPIIRAFSEMKFDAKSTKALSKSWSSLSGIADADHNTKTESPVRTEKNNNKPNMSMFITNPKALQENHVQNGVQSMSRLSIDKPKIKGSIRYSKSHEDLKNLCVPFERKPRANTLTKLRSNGKMADGEELHVRYVRREDRVKSAFTLPKI